MKPKTKPKSEFKPKTNTNAQTKLDPSILDHYAAAVGFMKKLTEPIQSEFLEEYRILIVKQPRNHYKIVLMRSMEDTALDNEDMRKRCLGKYNELLKQYGCKMTVLAVFKKKSN